MSRLFLPLILLLGVTVSGVASADFEVKAYKNSLNEDYERDVDKVALSAQEKAISKLISLLRKYRNTRQESILLAKLADIQQQTASIHFRIAHGTAHHSKTPIDLTVFRKSMNQAIDTLNTLISKYPSFPEISHAYFLRGKSYEELEKKDAATLDYLYLVRHYPDSEESIAAYMSLATFSIDANDHPKAIQYLLEVEKHPEDSHFPFALYKLAWSYYNLKNISVALKYAERHVEHYNSARSQHGQDELVTSDEALRENTLLDSTVFFFEGYEENLSKYQLSDALSYFRHLESGPVLGKMILRFTKLLRSHSHETDLIAWKEQVLAEEFKRPETLDVVLTAYEFQLNKRQYRQLVETSQDFVRLYPINQKNETLPKVQKLLLDTAEGLQTIIVKNKDATEVNSYSQTLASIYDAFMRIVNPSDARIPRAHYNLAETMFTIKDFQGATTHYRWVVENGQRGKWDDIKDASLKAIASRYEVLRQNQLIPKELAAKPFSKNSTANLDPLLAEWTEWLEAHLKHNSEGADNFAFEANRALYGQGHLIDSVERFKKFAFKNSKSSFAIPSASIALDTYIASDDWEKTHDLATDFFDVKEWKETEFSKRLFSVAADAYYKQVEALSRAKNFPDTIKLANKFLKKYPSSTRLADCLILAGNASTETGEKDLARKYFTRLITDAPDSDSVGTAILARADLSESKFQFSEAASDYRTYLSLPARLQKGDEGQKDSIRKKALALTWISGDSAELHEALGSKAICSDSNQLECEKYFALSKLGSLDTAVTEEAFEKARNASGPTKALWAAVALDGAKSLGFRDRNLMLRTFASGWDDLDPLLQFNLIPRISSSLPKTFHMNRLMMREVAPLRADAKYITHRVDVIREMENAATKIMNLPWSRVRAEVLNEIASVYLDLAKELESLVPPKGLSEKELASYNETVQKLVLPFEEKGQDMRAKAFAIASRFSIEDDSYHSISEPFFAENPSQAKALRPVGSAQKPAELSLQLLGDIDPSGKWDEAKSGELSNSKDLSLALKGLWAKAIQKNQWTQIAFFTQLAKEKKLIPPTLLLAMRAISFSSAGARGEGLADLEEAKKSLDPSARIRVVITLAQYAYQSCDREKTQSLIGELVPNTLNKEQASWVAQASSWTKERAPAAN